LNSAIVSTAKTMPNIVIIQKRQHEKLKTKWNFWPSGQWDALACWWSRVRIPAVAVNQLSVLICCWLWEVAVCERSL
jgi:hypothetical protein